VFGPTLERQSMDFDSRNRASMDTWSIEEEKVCIDEYKDCNYATVSIFVPIPETLLPPSYFQLKSTALLEEYNQ
jgi:hypothetical protein